MTYSPNLPISGDTLGSTRDRIRGNFQEIDLVTAVNHVAFNNADKGKHKFLQMPNQVSAPTTLANESGFYSKLATNPAESNLYFRGENNGFEYQLTGADQANSATFGTYTNYPPSVANQNGGWTFLPGGVLFQYGSMITTGILTTVDFPKAFTSTNISITLTRRSNTGRAAGVFNITTTTFGINRSLSASSDVIVYWHAIGI